jgi:hypothetical protein
MRDDEPDEPELSGNTDDASADDCIAQSTCEALKDPERAKKTYDLMVVLCSALVNKTLDECGENQAVSRAVADLQACMKASIVTHLSSARADSQRPSSNSPTAKKHPLPRSLPRASAESQYRKQRMALQRNS